jgi:O-antigen ligase
MRHRALVRKLQNTMFPRSRIRHFLLVLGRGCVLAVVLAAPWLRGGVDLFVQQYLYLGMLTGLMCWIMAAAVPTREPFPIALPSTLVPIVAALALGAVQLVPLGEDLLGNNRLLDPASAERPSANGIREDRPADGLVASVGHETISLDPASTRLDLSMLVLAFVTFLLGCLLFPDQHSRCWLWATFAFNGAALAFWGIATQLDTTETLSNVLSQSVRGSPFASFVNKNNAAGFLNLCLAGGIGFLYWSANQKSRSGENLRLEKSDSSTARHTVWGRLTGWIAQLDAIQLTALFCIILIVAGISSTLSRGGFVAMTFGGLACAAALAGAGKIRVMLLSMASVLVLSVALLSFTELAETVGDRLGSLLDGRIAQNARLSNWQDALESAADFPWLGTGLGTYRFAYLPHQTELMESWFYHAENQYVEALVDGGFIGIVLVLLAIVLTFSAIRRLLRSSSLHLADGVGYVGLFALTSQSLTSCFDFGLYIPSNLMLFALICGTVTGRATSRQRHQDEGSLFASPAFKSKRFVVPLSVALLVIGFLGWREVASAAGAEVAQSGIPQLDSPTSMPIQDLEKSIERLTDAVNRRPDDANLRVSLANLWIYRYRLTVDRLLAREPGMAGPEQQQRRWRFTDISLLHERANHFQQTGNRTKLRALCEDPIIVENLLPAAENLRAARIACPIRPRIDLNSATLAFLMDSTAPSGIENIRRAVRLTPADPDVMYQAGLLAEQGGYTQLANRYWQGSMELTERYRDRILDLKARRLHPSVP